MERLQEILALLADPSGLTDDDIGALEVELVELAADLRTEIAEAGADATPEQVMGVIEIANTVTAVRELAAERIDAAEAQAVVDAAEAQQVADMLAEAEAIINGPAEVEPEVEPVPEPTAEVEPEVVPEPEPVAAAATPPAPAAPARTPAVPRRFSPRATEPVSHLNMRRLDGSGGQFSSLMEIEEALVQRSRDIGAEAITGGKSRVAQIVGHYDEMHTLPEGRITEVDEFAAQVRSAAKAGDVAAFTALTADGGVCAPAENWYDFQRVAGTHTPLEDSLTSFNAKRGGVAFVPPAQLTSIGTAGTGTTNAIGAMTNAQDLAGATDKSYQVITCGTQTTVTVDAVWQQYEVGNMASRFNPERQTEFTELGAAAFARFNEQRLWTKMLALTQITDFPQKLGASRDLLTGLNRAAVNYRGALRMPEQAIVEVRLPSWAISGLLPDDQTNAMQSYAEQFQVTREWVVARLAERNIRVAGVYDDGFTTAITQGGGLNAYPAVLDVIMSHPGAFLFVDGGELDLGVFRDSTLVNNNTFRIFMERFWNLGMWGVQAWTIRFSLCANGASAGTRTPTCGS